MKKIILSILLILEIIMIGTVYSESVTKEISEELLRMHILANSDSECDQKIKIEVRDFLLKHINKNFSSKGETIKSVKDMEIKIDDFLKDRGVEYNCKVCYTNSIFDTREYSHIKIPAGKYETIKIILGNGEGENWWCVAYPPLCFTESVTGKMSNKGIERLKSELGKEVYNIIRNNKNEYKIKFRTVELFNSLFQKIN